MATGRWAILLTNDDGQQVISSIYESSRPSEPNGDRYQVISLSDVEKIGMVRQADGTFAFPVTPSNRGPVARKVVVPV